MITDAKQLHMNVNSQRLDYSVNENSSFLQHFVARQHKYS